MYNRRVLLCRAIQEEIILSTNTQLFKIPEYGIRPVLLEEALQKSIHKLNGVFESIGQIWACKFLNDRHDKLPNLSTGKAHKKSPEKPSPRTFYKLFYYNNLRDLPDTWVTEYTGDMGYTF